MLYVKADQSFQKRKHYRHEFVNSVPSFSSSPSAFPGEFFVSMLRKILDSPDFYEYSTEWRESSCTHKLDEYGETLKLNWPRNKSWRKKTI